MSYSLTQIQIVTQILIELYRHLWTPVWTPFSMDTLDELQLDTDHNRACSLPLHGWKPLALLGAKRGYDKLHDNSENLKSFKIPECF